MFDKYEDSPMKPVLAEDQRVSLMRQFVDVDRSIEGARCDQAELNQRLEEMLAVRSKIKRELMTYIDPSENVTASPMRGEF